MAMPGPMLNRQIANRESHGDGLPPKPQGLKTARGRAGSGEMCEERISAMKLSYRQDQILFGYELTGRKGNHEDTDNNSNNSVGFTVHGIRPDDGATTDGYADERHANYCAGEGEEGASSAGRGQTRGKTANGCNRTRTNKNEGSRSGCKQDRN